MITDSMNYLGTTYQLEYWDTDSFDNLPIEKCKQHYGVCFSNGKLLLTWGGKMQTWGLPGGTIEPGESLEETLRRELLEEANMEIINHQPLGVQKVTHSNGYYDYQLRSVGIIKPFGEFESDPDGSVKKIKLINPKNFRNYIKWGKIGDQMINRALEILPKLKSC